MKLILEPLNVKENDEGVGRGKFEKIIIRDEGDYPMSIVHCDFFYEAGNPDLYDIYEKLQNGETVTVEVEMRVVQS